MNCLTVPNSADSAVDLPNSAQQCRLCLNCLTVPNCADSAVDLPDSAQLCRLCLNYLTVQTLPELPDSA